MKIDTSLVRQASINTDVTNASAGSLMGTGNQQSIARLSPSGTYRFVYVDHYGDTRGDP